MAIYRLFEQSVFEPEDLDIIAAAYERVKASLGILDAQSTAGLALAKMVMRIAAEGPLEDDVIVARAVNAARGLARLDRAAPPAA